MIGESKENLAGRIEKSIQVLDELSSIISKYEIYNGANKVEKVKFINATRSKLANYLWKIKDNILEVAFIGLENSGKSTFVNAFVGKNILPTADERTTYITTQVRFNTKGKVKVYFYTEDEFLNNVFRKMLKGVGYPEPDIQTLDTISIDDFKNYFKKLKEKNAALYEKHENGLAKDIIEIIEGKEEIKPYLNGGLQEFTEEDIDRYQPFITDHYKSRAVKEVIIYSPKLKGLENVIIYDLPGFNSPTFIHSEFTMDKIKKADAVVFIREAKSPSLTRPEVEMITKTSEEDGLPLKEKMFFFAGMADNFYGHERDKLDKDMNSFVKELNKYNLFVSKDRIFTGSALAHLQSIGVKSGDGAIKRIKELGISTGINELKKALIDYNKTERVKVLERRINSLINETNSFLDETENILKMKLKKGDIAEFKASSVLEMRRNAVNAIENKVNYLLNSIKQSIIGTKRISKNLKKQLSNMDLMPSDEEMEKVKREIEASSVSSIELPDAFNRKVRNQIRKNVMTRFTNLVEESVTDEVNNFKEKVVNIFIEALNPSKEKEAELRENIKNFLEKDLQSFSYEVTGLRAVVDRFSCDIIELLTLPLSSQDRVNKFLSVENEIYSLMAFHESFNPKIPAEKMPLISFILLQEDIYDFSDNKLKEIIGNKLSDNDIKNLSSIIKRQRIPFNQVAKRLTKSLPYIKTFEDAVNVLDTITDEDEVDIYQMRENLKPPSTYNEVLEEIKRDVNYLKSIMQTAVVNAIFPEKASIASITECATHLKDTLNSKRFDDFLLKNFNLIRYDEYVDLVKRQTLNREIEDVLTKIGELKNSV